MRASRLLIGSALLGGLLLAYLLIWRPPTDRLVVYCAHDAVHAEPILRAFERQTGIELEIHYDTEATKSLGLVELIRRERDRPRCDVFWNNQLLGTLALHQEGLLLPYRGQGHARIPAAYKDPAGHWTGFGARLRVYIIGDSGGVAPATFVERTLAAGDLSSVAIAKPLYGTTLTHYSLLWQRWGADRTKQWHADWRRRGVREVPGNSAVKSAVAGGACRLGLTDTDDFFAARDAGAKVRMLPVTLSDGRAIVMPNTVAIVRGSSRRAAAQRLVDYLLSQRTEEALARGTARQLPLGPVDPQQLPAEVRELLPWVGKAYPLGGLGEARGACLKWLKEIYVR